MPQADEEQKHTNNYMNRLLAYVERDESFVKLIQQLESFISSTSGVVEYSIDSHNKPATSNDPTNIADSNSDLIYLQQLVNKLGISMDYFPADYTTSSSEEQRQRLKELYIIAIRGAVINRTGDATKVKLTQALQQMYPEATIEIIDGGDPEQTGLSVMNIQVYIRGMSATMNEAILSLYLRQNITGVQEQFNFDVSGTAIWSPINNLTVSEGDPVTVNMEIPTGSSLQTYFNSYGADKPYGYEENNPDKSTGTGGYMWVNIQDGGGENNFIQVPVINESIVYLSTGYWMIQLI